MSTLHPVLEARSISVTYAARRGIFGRSLGAIRAVENGHCRLAAGDTLGLVGESGCGKTTFAKALLGLLTPQAGEVLLHGRSRQALRGRERLAAHRAVQGVFQHPAGSLNPRLTVGETLSEPLVIHRIVSRAQRADRVRALLADVQLPSDYVSRLPRALSGGERQRVGIARALATEPEVLICDEPIASLDVTIGSQILELLARLCRERRMALLFISHDLGAVASLCRRVAVMQAGRMIEEGPIETVIRQPRHPYTELLLRSSRLEL
jgi:ABC-type glutathione transport system ATPase component